jgi:hypothetical protein
LSRLDQIAKIPSFTTTLRWRKAENYKETKRDWEAFWAFYWLYKDFPKHDNVENFLYAAFASANGVKHREKSIELGEEYLTNTDWKSFRADVTFIMANAYQSEAKTQDALAKSLDGAISTKDKERASVAKKKADEYYNRFFDLCDRFREVMPEHEYSRDFINMMGSVYFGRKRFDDLLVKFAGVENGVMDRSKGYVNNEKFNKSPAMAPAHYFSGLALLATGKFNEAKPLLGALVGVNVTGLPVKDLSGIDGLGGEKTVTKIEETIVVFVSLFLRYRCPFFVFRANGAIERLRECVLCFRFGLVGIGHNERHIGSKAFPIRIGQVLFS